MTEEDLKKKYVDALEEIKFLKKKNQALLEDATAATKSQISAIHYSNEIKGKNDILLATLRKKDMAIGLYKGKIIDLCKEKVELQKKNQQLEEEVKIQLSKTIILLKEKIEEQNLLTETRLKEINGEKKKMRICKSY